MYLKGKKVLLRSLEKYDLDMLRNLTNSPDFEQMITGWSFPVSETDQEKWFESYTPSEKNLRFIIETDDEGAVGMTGLKNIDWKNGVADAGGMRIAKKEIRSKGIATDAYLTLFKYAFEELRLNRINGSVLHYNDVSLHVTEKVGFKREGLQRHAIYKNGRYHDVIMLGILKKDYQEVVERLNYWN